MGYNVKAQPRHYNPYSPRRAVVSNYLYHGVRLRQRVHTVVISRSTVIHAERLPIEPQPTVHTVGYRRESSRLHIVQPPISKGS